MEEIVLFILLICVKGQPPAEPVKPDRCNKPAEFINRQCCIFPPFFTRDVAKACGAIFEITTRDSTHNITGFRRVPLTLCEHWKCMLQKYSLLNPDDTLDDDKYYSHLDKWVELNPVFTSVMVNAKDNCKSAYRMFLPLRVCEFYDLHGCIRNFINVDCPSVFPTKECEELKYFYNECREYYI